MKSFITNKKWLLIIVGVIIIGVLFFSFKKSQATTKLQTFVHPERKSLSQTISINGVIDSSEKARIFFSTGGKVTFIGAKEGEWVKKGQTIVSIDNRIANKQLQQDLNNYMIERLNWEQLQDDEVRNGFGEPEPIADIRTRRYIEQAQNKLDNSVLNVEIRSIAIQEASFRSPIEGILTKSPTTITGIPLSPSDVFEVVNPNKFFLKIAIDETDVGLIKEGMKASIELDAYPDITLDGSIRNIAFSGTQGTSGTLFLAEIELDNLDTLSKILRYGMNGNAKIILAQIDDALVIPLESTRTKDGQTVVDVKQNNGQIEERVIYTGLETDEEIEIIKGLMETDEIALPY